MMVLTTATVVREYYIMIYRYYIIGVKNAEPRIIIIYSIIYTIITTAGHARDQSSLQCPTHERRLSFSRIIQNGFDNFISHFFLFLPLHLNNVSKRHEYAALAAAYTHTSIDKIIKQRVVANRTKESGYRGERRACVCRAPI